MRQVERTPLGVWAGELSSEVCDRIIEEGKLLAQQIATINKDNPIDALLFPENISGDTPVTKEYINIPV